ncbi:MAG: AbrB/MazE/SpoVT family DNA-binding domain-containing protein [Nitrososphaeria archaeon]|nr:AbrB/MazE/SpoVT family DNA-binding domain-containing protein [Nitrososphaeria archaeon]
MEYEVIVTRKGQTTIPAKLRRKYNIVEGSRLLVTDTGEGILIKPAISTVDLAGSGSKYASPKEMKSLLDKLRDEDL